MPHELRHRFQLLLRGQLLVSYTQYDLEFGPESVAHDPEGHLHQHLMEVRSATAVNDPDGPGAGA